MKDMYYKCLKSGIRLSIHCRARLELLAGGISTVDDALLYWTIAKTVLGKDWLNNTRFRIGASRLADKLLDAIGN